MRLARKGSVTAIAQFLTAHSGSLLHSDDHLDSGRDLFLSRLEWDLEGFDIPEFSQLIVEGLVEVFGEFDGEDGIEIFRGPARCSSAKSPGLNEHGSSGAFCQGQNDFGRNTVRS